MKSTALALLEDDNKYLEEQIPNVWKKLNAEQTDANYTEGQSILVETLKEIEISDDPDQHLKIDIARGTVTN